MTLDACTAVVTGGTRGVGRGVAALAQVNNVWGGYDNMIENGQFTWAKPFWEQPLWRWDEMFQAGVRAHYRASQLAAHSMIAKGRGLVVNISHWAARRHLGNVAYGVSKAATDKIADA